MGGLKDPDRVDGDDVGRIAQERAEPTTRIGPHQRLEKFGRSGKWNVALGLIADDEETMSDRRCRSGLGQQPALAHPRVADEQEGGWAAIDGYRPTQGPNPVEFRGPTNERHGHGS
jgi:hypothetical protein